MFKKNLAYYNIKNHKKAGFHPLSRKHIFGKTTVRGQIEPHPRSCLRVMSFISFSVIQELQR